MTIEMLMLVALAQAPAAANAPGPSQVAKPATDGLSREEIERIQALVDQVVSERRAVPGKGSKEAPSTTRPAVRSAKPPARDVAESAQKPTTRPAAQTIQLPGRKASKAAADRRAGTVDRAGSEGRIAEKTVKPPARAKTKDAAEAKASEAAKKAAAESARPARMSRTVRPAERALPDMQSRRVIVTKDRFGGQIRVVPTTQRTRDLLEGLPDLSQLRGRVSIVATGPESIGIQGDPEDVAALEAIIRLLDAAEVPVKLEIYPLQNARAVQLAPMLSNLLSEAFRVPGRRARPSDQVIVVPDARSNSLLIGAAPDRLGEIRDIVAKLDAQPLIGPVQFKTFALKNMTASEAAELLQQMIQRLQAQRGVPGEAITVIPDDRTNTLIVTAPQADLVQVAEMIAMIDVAPAFATAKLVHIPLMNASAQALAQVFDEMLAQRMRGQRGQALTEQIRRLQMRTKDGRELPELDLEKPIKVTAEPGTNSLLISSTESNLQAMTEMVTLLDSVPISEAVVVRIFPLKDADAEELAQMLQTIFQQGKQLSTGPGGRPRGQAVAVPDSVVGEALMYNVGIAADTRTNTLLVSGREEQIQLAQEVVENLDKPGFATRWPVRMLQLQRADAQRLAQMIDQLMTQRLQTLRRLGPTAMERERVLVVADIRSNSLIIMAKEDNYQEVVELATKLDTTKSVAGDIRLVPLDKTQANVIAPKIEQLWERRARMLQQGGGSRDEPVIVTDERSNSLIVASNQEDFEAIKALVKTIEEAPLAPIADIRIIKLENNDAGVLAPTLQQLFQERMRMRQTPGARPLPSEQVVIMQDPVMNALLVACSNENYETLTELIKKLDVEIPLEGVVRFFVLQHADATRLAQMIEGMFQRGLYKPGTAGKQSAAMKERDKVVIEPDLRTNTLIVSASKENYSIIERLIKEMDVKDAPFLEGNVKLYKVQHGDAVKLSGMLEEVLQRMQQFRQRAAPELPVTVLADEGSNTLIISGSRDVLTQADSLLAQLDKPSDEPTREIKPYPLIHSSAAKVATILEDLFQERGRGAGRRETRGAPPFVQALETANILIVQANQEDHQIVEGLLKHIDIKSEGSKRVKIFPLQQAQAEDLQQVIQDLYSQQRAPGARGGAGRGAEPGISLSTDPQTNSLIVWAAPSEMEDITELIKNLDTTNPRDETRVRIFRLKQADAEDLAKVLQDILTGRGAGGARRGGAADSVLISYAGKDAQTGEEVIHKLVRRNVQIVPDTLTNSLVVRATPESMKMLEELISTIDEIPPREVDVRVFNLINADADQMVKVLEKLFQVDERGRRGGRGAAEEEVRLTAGAMAPGLGGEGLGPPGRQLLRFTPDTRTNSVIVAGTEEYLVLAEKLIRELDEQEIEERTNMVYQVKYAKASDLEKALKTHFDNISKLYRDLGDEEAKLRQIEREVSVVADDGTGSLLVSASPRYESQVMKMVNELDRPPPQVKITVLIAEVTLDDSVELGMEFAIQDLLFSETAYVGNNNTIKGDSFDFVAGTDLGAAGATLGGFSFTITGEDFNFLLRALQTEGRLEVLSRPLLLAEDNMKAKIQIGQKVPFVGNVNILSDGRTQTIVEYEEVGVIMEVTPHINPDGYVSLEITPEISALSDSSVQVTEGVFAPIFNKRNVETSVTVKGGETVVIGGLITTQEEHRETKVPLLGDIPGLGNLFKATVASKNKTELLFVLTPEVVRDERDAREQSVQERDKIDLLPDSIRRSPLMDRLQVKPEEDLLAPLEWEQKPPDAETPSDRKPIRMEYGPTRPSYGPAKPALISQETPPQKMIGPDDYESYLRQRR